VSKRLALAIWCTIPLTALAFVLLDINYRLARPVFLSFAIMAW
jgi:hypothetical protein